MKQTVMITGAAGLIGSMLRARWRGTRSLVLVDRAEMAAAGPGEIVVRCDVADAATMRSAMAGVDAVVHLGGVPTEADWDVIRDANIEGCYQTFEAARLAGVRRMVFASSNHAIGFHERGTRLDGSEPVRPDTRYGVSKVFGEALARYYADKFGLSAVCLRIGYEPQDSADDWHDRIAEHANDRDPIARKLQGGIFCAWEHPGRAA
jgi:uronate dehydrogenase